MTDPTEVLHAGAEQPLLTEEDSLLLNPGTVGADDRSPNPVPMYPYGYERDGDPLFTLHPERKG